MDRDRPLGGTEPATSQLLGQSMWLGRSAAAQSELTVGAALRATAAEYASNPALVAVGGDGRTSRSLTYAELLDQVELGARALAGRFERHARVAVYAPNSVEWVVLEFAAALAGVVLITVNPAFAFDELCQILARAGACAIFWGHQPKASATIEQLNGFPKIRECIELRGFERFCHSSKGNERLPDVRPDDEVQIQHTSGTTGMPKAVLLTHRSIMTRARIGAAMACLCPSDRMINPMPMFHTSGCNWMALGSIVSGAAHVLLPGFEPGTVLKAIEQQRGTTLVGFATMLQSVVEQPDIAAFDLTSLRYVVSGGTSVPTALARRIEERLGARLSVLYGMTECSGVVTQTSIDDPIERVGTSVGQPFPETDLKITDPFTGRVLPVGEIGELCVRGGLVMSGYVGEPSPIDGEGWFHTGDFGSLDASGYCSVEGRRYDLIVRNGRYLSPRPLEEKLASHPDVAEVVVLALPDEDGGHFVATIRPVTGTSPDLDELRACASSVDCPSPARWTFVDRLPLTGTGKVHRHLIQEQLLQVEPGAREGK